MYDVIIIGSGVSGSAAARELSRYKLKVCVLEKCEDVCCGTSKANSGIVHAGFDAAEGSLMAELNVKGNQMMGRLSEELDIPFRQTGAFVICSSESDLPRLNRLLERGRKNGVDGLRILNRNELKRMEPNISDTAYAALYAPTSGIICPFELNIALAENACENGTEFFFRTEVQNVANKAGTWEVATNNGIYRGKCVVNAAGVYADNFHNMVSSRKIHITLRKGEYCLLDRTAGDHVKHTVFTLPGKFGKGVLVTPTIHGNLLIGPTASDITDKEGVNTTGAGLEEVSRKASESVKDIPFRKVITSFAGLRAHEDGHEFLIEEVREAPGFIDCAGIESPGLTSAPAIGVRIAEIICGILRPEKKENFCAVRKGIVNPADLTREERADLIRKNPAYGNIICRCEMISEGEIIDAVHRPLGAKSLDGVKRRTRAGMGRCQSGFCSPKTMEILSRELGIPMENITKSGGNSRIITGINKDSV